MDTSCSLIIGDGLILVSFVEGFSLSCLKKSVKVS